MPHIHSEYSERPPPQVAAPQKLFLLVLDLYRRLGKFGSFGCLRNRRRLGLFDLSLSNRKSAAGCLEPNLRSGAGYAGKRCPVAPFARRQGGAVIVVRLAPLGTRLEV